MLFQLASVTTTFIRSQRSETRLSRKERAEVNGIARFASQHKLSMRLSDIRLVRTVLRHTSVKEVLKRYNGRRNAGTRRTLRLASGVES